MQATLRASLALLLMCVMGVMFSRVAEAAPPPDLAFSITSSKNPSVVTESVTFTITVTSSSGTPTGTVQLVQGSQTTYTIYGTEPLVNGMATITTNAMGPQINNLKVRYFADGIDVDFGPYVESDPYAQVVNPLPSTLNLTSSLNPSEPGQSVTFTATLTSSFPSSTQTVQFFDGPTVIGTASMNGNTASFSTSDLTLGTHGITASYPGDGLISAATSSPLSQVVQPATAPFSEAISNIQANASTMAAQLSSEAVTDSTDDAIAQALSGQVQVLSASDGQVGLQWAPGMRFGNTMVSPVADVPGLTMTDSALRFWANLRYASAAGGGIDGTQVNGLLGASVLLGNGMVAGLVTGYEAADYTDAAAATFHGKGFSLGGYVGGKIAGNLKFDAQVHGTLLDYNLAAGPVTADFNARRLLASSGLSYRWQLAGLDIDSALRGAGTWEWQDAYDDSAAAAHAAHDFSFGRVSFGSKISHGFDLGEGGSFRPFVSSFADYRFSRSDMTANAALDGLSSRLGAGFDIRTSRGVMMGLQGEYTGLGLSNGAHATTGKAYLSIAF